MKKEKGIWKKWIYWFSLGVAIILVYKTLDSFTQIGNFLGNLIEIVMPFIIGILLAYLFYLPSRWFEKIYKKSKIKIIHKKARGLSVFTVYIISLVMFFLGIKFILPNLSQSIIDLGNNLPSYYETAIKSIENSPEDSILNKINAKEIIQNISKIDIKQFFNIEMIAQYIQGVINFASGIFSFLVSIIVSIYLLLERAEIRQFISKLARAIWKPDTCKNLGKYFNCTNDIFFKFLSSQLLDAIVVGILTSIAMWIIGVKYAFLLGFMIGLFNLIPYFGAIIAVAIAILITLLTGGISQAFWMAIVIIVLQQIDANIINPKIVGNSLKISPLLVIFAVTIGGAYFGVLGMFLAVPIITVLKLLLTDYIELVAKEEENIRAS